MVGVLAIGGLVLTAAACGKAPDKGATTAASASGAKKTMACMVTDTGGIDDKSFNAAAWSGLQAAKARQLQHHGRVRRVDDGGGLRAKPDGFVQQKCDLILAVGGLMGGDTDKVATANPNEQFAIVDYGSKAKNVYSMQFDTAQAGYLAGYLAAGMSKTGNVGTYGGLKIPPVTIFMDGFADGVAHYNQVKGKSVKVLGWDKAKQNGSSPTASLTRPVARRWRDPQQPGRRRHHAGRRWHGPRHRVGGAGVRRQVQRHLGRPGRLHQGRELLLGVPEHGARRTSRTR